MGAAVGIASAAVGAVGTISGISAQRRQEQAQQDAIDAQAAASSANLSLRTQEIERQKLFVQFQSEVDRLNRESERVFTQFENFAAEQQFQQQEIALQQQLAEQTLLSDRQAQLEQFQSEQARTQQLNQLGSRQTLENVQAGSQLAQLGIQDTNALLQRQLTGGDITRQRVGEAARFNQQDIANRQAFIQQLAGTARGTQQELLNLANQNIGQQSQIAGALDQIQQELLASVTSQRDQSKARALATVQLAGGATAGLSASDLALLEENLAQEQTNFAATSSRSQRLIDQLQQDSEFANNLSAQLSQAARLRGLANTLGIVTQQDAASSQNLIQNLLTTNQINQAGTQADVTLANQLAQGAIARGQLGATQGLSALDILAQRQQVNQQTNLQQGLSNIQNIENQLALQQQAELQLADIGLSRGAQGLLASEQRNRQDLQAASARINQAFSEQALQSQLLGTQAAGASEQAALAAARRGAGSGFGRTVGLIGGLANAGTRIAGILSSQNQQPQVTNPLFQQSSLGFLNRSVFSNPAPIPQSQAPTQFSGNVSNVNLGF